MSNITPFSSDEFELSILPDGDSFRVLAPGLAHALGMRDATRLLENIPGTEKGYTTACTPGGEQRVGYVTEAGFYRALGQRQAARVKNPEIRDQVERFQTWVYTEVLPAIRRTGTYATTPSVPQPDLSELSPRNLAYLSELAKGLEAAVKHAEKNQRKADGYDQFLNGSGCYLVDTAANLLGVKHRRLWEWLYTSKLLIPHGPRKRQPYANPKTASWFAVKTYNTDRTNGKARATTYITPVGLEAIRLRLIREGVIQSTLFALPAPAQEVLA